MPDEIENIENEENCVSNNPRHVSFPSIEQFKSTCKHVGDRVTFDGFDENNEVKRNRNAVMPKLKFIGTTKLHGCLHSETLVTLSNGEQEPISSIKPGMSILSFNELTKEIEFDTVKAVIVKDADKQWLELEFDNGIKIKCTADHLFLTGDGWIEASNLTKDHTFVTDGVCV